MSRMPNGTGSFSICSISLAILSTIGTPRLRIPTMIRSSIPRFFSTTSMAIRRMAIEVVEKNRGIDDLIIVGIRSRGVPIVERIAKEIEQMENEPVPFGILDITLYRDDLTTIA